MKLRNKILTLTVAMTAVAMPMAAQHTYSGYFLDNYTYRYEMNPALADTTSNFVGFPGLGNLNIGMQGNLHVRNLIDNIDGKTVLFTNPGVPESVLDKFSDKNVMGMNFKINILNGGFKAFGGYNTVGINLRGRADVSVPKSFFSLLKEGVSNNTYSIENLRAHADAYAEIAFNHSRNIKQVPGLRVGAAVKFIIGIAGFDAYFDEANLNLGYDSWDIQSNARIYSMVKGMNYTTSFNDKTGMNYVDGADVDNFGLNGFGLGFDLGAEYKWKDFKFSLSFLDLGFINWFDSNEATTNGVKNFSTSDYTFDLGNGADDAWDEMVDDLSQLYQLEDKGNTGSRTTSLATTINIGVAYELPYYRNLTFGLLNTTRIAGMFTNTQFRLSANVRPVSMFSASVSVVGGTYGWGFGWLLNLRLNIGFNMFLGMDHTPGKMAKPFVPLNSNAKFNFGIDFPF